MWVLGSSKAVDAACLAIFDPSTNSALSRQPESVKKCHMGVYQYREMRWFWARPETPTFHAPKSPQGHVAFQRTRARSSAPMLGRRAARIKTL
jgi:hypothetical protein